MLTHGNLMELGTVDATESRIGFHKVHCKRPEQLSENENKEVRQGKGAVPFFFQPILLISIKC